ncbi:serine acetyltransferase [Facklamia sp. DSM 111018]|uniref:Serine acetyltransferase n=1 Tax=Facklamia lactis TaxID=2749967 RepID=A0ABS0LMK6_9LACT|nr:DapH/DapD/GlmU-related protein [Facklamia lactis]MBG9979942.1 serine acetyltransferase [Facklamia lactis]MBG9985378.1 serine acetyltransferase [Facklamia lactis]
MNQNIVMKMYNFSRKCYEKRLVFLARMCWMFNRIIFCADVPYTAKIDPTVRLGHNGLGIVMHVDTIVGANTLIMQNVTLGHNFGRTREDGTTGTSPTIGENVFIGANACVLGPVKVGNYAQIAAGSIVLSDVPEYSVVAGVPAKIIKTLTEEEAKYSMTKW